MKPEPFRIEPAFVPRIWGSRSLAPLYPEKTRLSEPIGEVWLTGVDCKVATGPFAGKTLGQAWHEMPSGWRGTRFVEPGDFPILVKFIFPNDKLSIQVHPDDAYAAAHEKAAGGRGKTEMWYAVSAEPNAKVLVGLKPGVNKEKFREAIGSHGLEDLLESHAVHAGDMFFVPAGTPHTIGPGMVLCEVQEYSDLTYRVYDYGRVDAQGRPRELHVAKAMEVINFSSSARRPLRVERARREKGSAARECLAACQHFEVEKWHAGNVRGNTGAEQFEMLTIVEGGGAIRSGQRDFACLTGEMWFLPASLGQYIFSPQATVLRTRVPDIRALERVFVNKGYSEEERQRFIFT